MKRKAFIIISCLPQVLMCCCQNINWEWGRGSMGDGVQEGVATAVDSSGDVYVTGYYQLDSIIFDTVTLQNNVNANPFIAKYSSSGNFLWARGANLTTDQNVHFRSLTTDGSNNLYVAGSYQGDSINLDGVPLHTGSGGYLSCVLAKYDSAGNILWAKCAAEPGYNDEGYGVITDIRGNIYLTGYFSGDSLSFGDLVLYPTGINSMHWFVAKFDPSGNTLWAKTTRSNSRGNDQGWAITADGSGNVYLCSYFSSDSLIVGNFTLQANGYGQTGCIVKYDSLGNVLWANSLEGDPNPYAIAADKNGNVYTTGTFLDGILFFGADSLTGDMGSYNLYVAKYGPSGNLIWAKAVDGGTGVYGYALGTGPNGLVYLCGGYDDTRTITIDTTVFTAPPVYADALFVAAFDSSGRVVCASVLGSGGDDIFGVGVDKNGNGYIGSDFEMNYFIVGPDTLLRTNMNDNDEENIYVARFSCPYCESSTGSLNYQLSPASVCLGDSAIIIFAGDSALNISPASCVTWIDSLRATLKPDTTTTFTISGYNSCSIRQSQTFTLPVLSNSVSISTSLTTICPGDSAQICAPAGYASYAWSNGATTTCTNTRDAGSYTVTVTATGNCSATSNTVNISIYQPSPVTISVSNDTLSVIGGIAYQWFINGVAITGATGSVYIATTSGTYTVQVTDAHGCTANSSPVVVTGIAGALSRESISIRPNPTSNSITVSASIPIRQIEITNTLGQTVLAKTYNNNNVTVNLENLPAGIYVVRVNEAAVYKVVKE